VDSDGTIDDEILDVPTSVHDNSSTAFSSRAGSPSEEQMPDPVGFSKCAQSIFRIKLIPEKSFSGRKSKNVQFSLQYTHLFP
jgi:hypothetical protein